MDVLNPKMHYPKRVVWNWSIGYQTTRRPIAMHTACTLGYLHGRLDSSSCVVATSLHRGRTAWRLSAKD